MADDRGPEVVAVAIVFIVLSISSVSLRFYTRWRLVKWIGVDDILILVALAAAIVQAVSSFLAVDYGLGKHVWHLDLKLIRACGISVISNTLAYVIAATFIKISILFLYLRLSPDRLFRNLNYIVILICVLFGIAAVICTVVQCIPLSQLWHPTREGRCFNFQVYIQAFSAIHIFTEVAIYALPLHILWNLRMPVRQKFGVLCIFSIGILLIGISCYRLVLSRHLASSWDKTWDLGRIITWQTIEVNLAILIACGPSFVAFTRHHFPSFFDGGSNFRRGQSSSSGKHHMNQGRPDVPIRSSSRFCLSAGQSHSLKVQGSGRSNLNTILEDEEGAREDCREVFVSMTSTMTTEDGYVTGDEELKGVRYEETVDGNVTNV